MGCATDKNCVVSIQKVHSIYGGKAPISSHPIPSKPASMTKKSAKRRKHSEDKETKWTKKICRTRSAAGEEEETITLNLRKADTVIGVSIVSPAKRKSVSRRLPSANEAADSSGREATSVLQGATCSSTHGKPSRSRKSRRTADGGGSLYPSQVELPRKKRHQKEHDTQTAVKNTRRCKSVGEGVKKCLQGRLDLVTPAIPTEDVGIENSAATTTIVVEPGPSTLPCVAGPSTLPCIAGPSTLPCIAGPSTVVASPLSLVPVEVARTETKTVQENNELYSRAECNGTFSFPEAGAVSVDAGGLQVGPLTQETKATPEIEVGEFPAEEVAEVPDPIEPAHVQVADAAVLMEDDTHQEGQTYTEEFSLNPDPKKKTGKQKKATATASTPAREETSSRTTPALKPCQLTVATCLENLKRAKERSRSPSPLPPASPTMASPRTRPPRPSLPRQTTSMAALRLVPIPNDTSQSKAGVTSPEEVTRSLDSLLSQLPADEVAKYFSRKANVRIRV